MNADTLQARANAVDWWHGGIDLGQGITTQGRTSPANTLLPYLKLPADLSGKTVVDICAWDGFMAFECEKRGARVTAVDSLAWDKRNAALTKHRTGRDGFNLAHNARGSKVTAYQREVLELDPLDTGTFNIVLFLGVLYHMRHPLLALEKVAALADDLLIVESYVEGYVDTPSMRFIAGDELNGDPTNWWAPTPSCVKAMLHDVGFASVTVSPGSSTRAVFHARRAA